MSTANVDERFKKPNRNLPIDDELRTNIAKAVSDVRSTTPLAQSLTNFVTINLVANAQLAVGGSAAMHYSAEEAHALNCGMSKATYINMGTLLPDFRTEYPKAAADSVQSGLPWVLDPVGAGAGALRNAILKDFKSTPPTIIRCNASEAIALAGIWGLDVPGAGKSHAGVESTDEVEAAVPAAHALARFTGGVVSVSGAVDLVTDGTHDFSLPGGSVWLTKITGAGCSLGGVTATYACVSDPLTAALAAALHYNRAADAAERVANGPGSFQTAFLDALWNTTADEISQSTIFIHDVRQDAVPDDASADNHHTVAATKPTDTVMVSDAIDAQQKDATSPTSDDEQNITLNTDTDIATVDRYVNTLAQLTIWPTGVGEELSEYVAEVIRVIRESGITNETHSMSTELEGNYDDIVALVKKAAFVLYDHGYRTQVSLQMDMRPGYRDQMHHKVDLVNKILERPSR